MAFGIFEHWVTILGVIVTLIGTGGAGAILKTWLVHKRGVRTQTDDVSIRLVHEMRERMASVEAGAERDRERQAEERQRAERRERLCDAKLGFEHHRVNNLLMLYQSFLMLMQIAPEKMTDMLEALVKRREQQEQLEATERAAILAFEAQLAGMDRKEAA